VHDRPVGYGVQQRLGGRNSLIVFSAKLLADRYSVSFRPSFSIFDGVVLALEYGAMLYGSLQQYDTVENRSRTPLPKLVHGLQTSLRPEAMRHDDQLRLFRHSLSEPFQK